MFRRTVLSCHGTTFTRTDVNFQDAYFEGGAMEFVGCTFDHSTLNLRRLDARVRGIYFYRSEFSGSSIVGQDVALFNGAIRIEHCTLTDTTIDVRTLNPEFEAVRFANNAVIGGGEPEALPTSQPQ